MKILVAGMNKYRAWIDGGELRIAIANGLLSSLITLTLLGICYTSLFGWWWVGLAVVVAVPLEVYLGIAQMTRWRWDDQ